METYRQTDPRWKDKPLGQSPYHMGTPGVGYGCTTTAVAQLLALAGYPITPGDMNDALNAHGGYTDRHYQPSWPDGGSGLILWRNPGVAGCFPQFHFADGGPYHLWIGDLGAYNHWISEFGGTFYDSISGRTTTNVNELTSFCGVKNLRLAYSCSIDAPHVDPAPEYPKTVTVGQDGARIRPQAARKTPDGRNIWVDPATGEISTVYSAFYKAGATFTANGIVDSENIDGNDKWYTVDHGYVWTGACK